jgi:hypothetical protein
MSLVDANGNIAPVAWFVVGFIGYDDQPLGYTICQAPSIALAISAAFHLRAGIEDTGLSAYHVPEELIVNVADSYRNRLLSIEEMNAVLASEPLASLAAIIRGWT